MQIDLTRVTDLAERQEIARLWQAAQDAQAALDAAEEAYRKPINDKFAPLFDAEHDRHNDRLAELNRQRNAELEAAGGPVLDELEAKRDAADQAYSEHPLAPSTITDEDTGEERIETCALTGVPLLDGDVLMVDEDTGEKILKAALGRDLDDEGAFIKAETEQAKAA